MCFRVISHDKKEITNLRFTVEDLIVYSRINNNKQRDRLYDVIEVKFLPIKSPFWPDNVRSPDVILSPELVKKKKRTVPGPLNPKQCF